MDNFTNIKSDSGWEQLPSSRPSRGIYDYMRRIEFVMTPSEAEVESVRVYLRDNNCPGWTGVTVISVTPEVYKFYTCYDSSD